MFIASVDPPIEYEQQRYVFKFGDTEFVSEIWDGLSSPAQDKAIAIDTETLPIVTGQVPPVALMQVYYPSSKFVQLVQGHANIQTYLQHLLELNPSTTFVFHNFPFDYEVLGGRKNKLLLNAITRNQIVDTQLRWLLRQGYEGNWVTSVMPYELDSICEKLLGIYVDKNNDIRCTFKPDVKMTYDHIKYASIDPVATMQVYQALPYKDPTEQLQVRAAVALYDISLRGMFVDKDMFKKLTDKYTQLEMDALHTMMVYGYFPGEPGVTARQLQILENIEQRCGIRFPRTAKTKQISASSGILAEFSNNIHPFLTATQVQENAHKFLTSYLNKDFLGADGRVHPRFETLVRTGRTSCSKPPLQQMPRSGGIREQYRAAPGKCLLAVDYCQQELVALAQSCLWFFQEQGSVMAQLINDGKDLHKELGKQIMAFSGGNPKDGVDYRQLAKSVNFGAPGGLGKRTFVEYAKTNYGVTVTEDQAADLIRIWKETFPEMQHHLRPRPDPQHSGMFLGEVMTGRIRSNANFCSACNTRFQGLAADCSKKALWNAYMAEVPSVNFVHDELISEWPIDDQLQEHVDLVQGILINSMQSICTDVKVRVEATLMINWNKKAKPIFAEDGHKLLIWTPDIIPVDSKDKTEKWRKLVDKSYDELAATPKELMPVPKDYRCVWQEGGKQLYGWQPLKSAYN